jgi:tellurite resistance protein TerC
MEAQTILFLFFGITIVGFLIADLGFFNRKAHKVSTKSALVQSLFWIAVALIFAALINQFQSRDLAVEFLSAYVTEKMLSVDNLFVILLIFSFFKLEEQYHHRVLFWGILGAIVFRGVFIGAGVHFWPYSSLHRHKASQGQKGRAYKLPREWSA